MLSKYGTDNIIVMLTAGVLLVLIAFFIKNSWISFPIGITGVLLISFTLWFFRDPERKTPDYALNDESIVISPADGRIVEIVEEDENIFLKERCMRISIFLAPIDVHVNRAPVSGVVEFFEYIPGDYLVAYHPKSSIENEQTHIGMENSHGKVFFKQIVGILARRLVWDIKVGDTLKVGQRFGLMKFGSRMDISVKVNSDINVKIGQYVKAGITELAKLKAN